jgi:hypothetical protein
VVAKSIKPIRVRLLISVFLCSIWGREGSAQSAEPVAAPRTAYLELYVNSSDPKHFTAVLDRAIALQQKETIPIAAIYHIGDFNNVTPETQAKLWRARLKLFALSGVPSDLPIVTSPAWVFVTAHERRIVEGTVWIENFIDDAGEFRDGSQMANPAGSAPPTPKEKMEGF